MSNKKIIPIFFAVDDGYVPFLSVALKSMLCNASKKYNYKIYILMTDLTLENREKLNMFNSENVSLEYVNVKEKLDTIGGKLHLRDYYSKAIYYRVFIPSMFPQYDKAIYLDCDIVIPGDISKLFNTRLGNKLMGVVSEEVMATVKTFGDYSEKTLGVKYQKYFNSGILLMNLKRLREENIEGKFFTLLKKFKFIVAPDQDYLNVICKDRVLYLNKGWNKTPIKDENFSEKNLFLIHYKMAWKPWQYDGILYGEYFWEYAKMTDFYEKILSIKENYSAEKVENDKKSYNKLLQTAINDINDPNNYYSVMKRNLILKQKREKVKDKKINSLLVKLFSQNEESLLIDLNSLSFVGR